MQKDMVLLDTNVVLRYILKDIAEQHKKTVEFITQNSSAIRLEVLVEVIYVLEKYYKKTRPQIAEIITALGNTQNLLLQFPHVVAKALVFYVDDKLDIVYSILCAFNVVAGYDVFTFDKKMNVLMVREKKVVI